MERTCIGLGDSPLDVLERSFKLLISGPRPLALNGRKIGHGLPGRLVTITEIRRHLPAMYAPGRDAVWRELLRIARDGHSSWTVVCAGLALPGLRTAAAALTRGYSGDPAELDAEVLAGFVAGIKVVDLDRSHLCAWLRQYAYNAGRRVRYGEIGHGLREICADVPESMAPPQPCAHPDVVLARAAAAGALDEREAELIGRVYLEQRAIREVAAELQMARTTAQDVLKRGVGKLVRWLEAEKKSG
jgi:DNA-directed RNA polymerase specialized sigma24 family protein